MNSHEVAGKVSETVFAIVNVTWQQFVIVGKT